MPSATSPALLVPEFMDYRPRSQVEEDPAFKQIIPYVVFRSGDGVFCYTRGKSQGEARLHRLRSLGVGGHVSEDDAQGGRTLDAYEAALRRELDEEVDDRQPRSHPTRRPDQRRRHRRGARPPGRRPSLRARTSPGLTRERMDWPRPDSCRWRRSASLRDEFETWSQICIDSLLEGWLSRLG